MEKAYKIRLDHLWRTDAEAEAPILWPPDVKNRLTWKDPGAGKNWGQKEKGATEDEMAGWHHWFNSVKHSLAREQFVSTSLSPLATTLYFLQIVLSFLCWPCCKYI